MGLKKGQTNNPNGRPEGSISEKTKQWDILGNYITELAADKLQKELDKLEGADFINAYSKILAYFKPQLARTEIKDTTEVRRPIEVIVKDKQSKENIDRLIN